MTLRNLARIGATGALAVGALGLAATPALAADVDFGVKADDTTIAAGANVKGVAFTVTNNGTTKPEKVEIILDTTGLDANKVSIIDTEECSRSGKLLTCPFDDELIPIPGAAADAQLPLGTKPGATGAAGKLKISVKIAGDTVKANDSTTIDVTIGKSGVDLSTIAFDVTEGEADEEPTGKAVKPGAVAPLVALVMNQGDQSSVGIEVEVKLPEDTTFAAAVPGCVQASSKRSLTCTYKNVTLLPIAKGDNLEDFALVKNFPVKVDANAKGPVSLTGGVVTATPLAQKPFSARGSRAAAEVPEGFSRPTAALVADIDVDKLDNSDDFAVLVAGSATGGGGSADDGDDEGDDDNGGGLPLTGPAGYAIGGTGLAAIALGLGLFVAARRRRVVLVTPGDEK